MPELPEVQTVVTQIRRAVEGRTVETAVVHRPDYIRVGGKSLTRTLPGRSFAAVGRIGKRIVIDLAPTGQLVLHLGMSGRVTFQPRAADLAPHTHLVLRFVDFPDELRMSDPRRFGGVWYGPTGPVAETPGVGRLGPDALDIDHHTLRDIAAHRRQIKALLLDQRFISGMGNIYCDEALFAARIHPLTRACDLESRQVATLATCIRRTLRSAVEFGGSTLRDYRGPDGEPGYFQTHHRVYGQAGKPCRRCRAPIEKAVIAGRTTHYCPICQPTRRSRSTGGAR